MDAAHMHLLLNHLPVLGTIFALALLAYGLARDSDDVVRTGLWTLVAVGVASVVVYLTGEPAEELVEGVAGVSEAALEEHEEIALRATWAGGLLGAAALTGLWIYRRASVARPFATAALLLTLLVSGLMAWTANSGGKVHHPELRGSVAAAEAGEAGRAPTAESPAPASGEEPSPAGEETGAGEEEEADGNH